MSLVLSTRHGVLDHGTVNLASSLSVCAVHTNPRGLASMQLHLFGPPDNDNPPAARVEGPVQVEVTIWIRCASLATSCDIEELRCRMCSMGGVTQGQPQDPRSEQPMAIRATETTTALGSGHGLLPQSCEELCNFFQPRLHRNASHYCFRICCREPPAGADILLPDSDVTNSRLSRLMKGAYGRGMYTAANDRTRPDESMHRTEGDCSRLHRNVICHAKKTAHSNSLRHRCLP